MKRRISVRTRAGVVVDHIRRVIRQESIGNFCPFFCTYNGNPRCLVKSDDGDLSDPFRREEAYLDTLYIEI